MKKPLLFGILLLVACFGYSQRVYFIYLQSDNGQPFYARLDEKVYSSSASGYLILPSLRDTAHQLVVGFVNSQIPENRYNISLNRKDRGYLIKNFGERGWGLFDLQDLSITSPVREGTSSMKTERLPANQFTDMLVRAADDSTLRDRPVLVKEEKKPEEKVEQSNVETTTKTDPPVTTKKDDVASVQKQDPKNENEVTENTAKKETEKPIDNKKDTVAVVVVPKDLNKEKNTESKPADQAKNEVKDDIKTVKPADTQSVVTKQPPETKLNEAKDEVNTPVVSKIQTDTVAIVKVEKPAQNSETKVVKEPEFVRSTILRRSESSTTEGFGLTFVDLLPDGSTDTIRIMIPNQARSFGIKEQKEQPRDEKRFLEIGTDSVRQPVATLRPANCKEFASDADFFKLRKKMASASSDESMLNEAKKVFRTRCFTTEQLKNLSTLFLRDEGKYKFFDAAFPAASDPENFPTLANELREEIYLNRFKAYYKVQGF